MPEGGIVHYFKNVSDKMAQLLCIVVLAGLGLQQKLGTTVKINANLNGCLPNTLSVAFDTDDEHVLDALINKSETFKHYINFDRLELAKAA